MHTKTTHTSEMRCTLESTRREARTHTHTCRTRTHTIYTCRHTNFNQLTSPTNDNQATRTHSQRRPTRCTHNDQFQAKREQFEADRHQSTTSRSLIRFQHQVQHISRRVIKQSPFGSMCVRPHTPCHYHYGCLYHLLTGFY